MTWVPPSLLEFREHLEQVKRLRCRVDGRQLTSGKAVLDGTDQSRRQPRCAEDGIDQVCGCGFSVRARDADDFQPPVGVVIEVACRGRKGLPPMLDLNPGASKSGGGGSSLTTATAPLAIAWAANCGRPPWLPGTRRTSSLARLYVNRMRCP